MTGLNYLFYTVGNRDLRLDGQVPPPGRFRSVCEDFLGRVRADPAELDRVEAPQLKNCLDYLAGQGLRLNRVYLIATAENPDPQYRETDTAPAAELLINWLNRLKQTAPYATLLSQAEPRTLVLRGQNPAEYAGVYRWLRQALARLTEPETVWVHPVSGTPAMTMGLVLAAVGRWGERVRLLWQTPATPVEEDALTLEIVRETVRGRILDRLGQLDFAGAAALTQMGPEAAGGTQPAEAVSLLVGAGLERTRFNFRAAEQKLAAALPRINDPAAKEAIRKLRVGLEPLLTRPESAAESRPFLVELIYNARACWRAGREIDFLGRVYRLDEGLRRYLLEKLGFPTDESPDRRESTRSGFWDRVNDLGLLEHLPRDPGIQVNGSVNRPAMLGVLKALLEASPPGLDLGLVGQFLPWLEGPLNELSILRNRTILGHDFDPVNRAEIEATVRAKTGLDVEAWLEAMATALDPDARDPFEATVGVVRQVLRE